MRPRSASRTDRPARFPGMNYRPFARTGVKVSPLCLGAMMFGAWGNSGPRRVRSGSSTARSTRASTSSTRPTCTRAGSPRRSSARRWPAAGATTSCSRPRSTATMGDDPNQCGNSRRWIIREVENSLRRLGDRLDRPLPDPPPRARHRHRRDARRAHRPRARRARSATSAPRPSRPADRRGAVGRAASAAASASCASSRRTRSSSAGSRPTCCPTCQRHGMGVIPWSPLAGGWLTGRYRKGAELPQSHRAERIPARYDMSLPGQPAQARGGRRARPARRGGRHDA